MSEPTSHGPPPPVTTKPGKKDIAVVRATFSYTAHNNAELSFEEGQVLYVVGVDKDKDWLHCRMGNKQGLVPANYVGENTAQIDNPLHDAAKRGNVAFARELIDAGISLNGFDRVKNSPIHWACRGGHAEIVEMLLKKKVVINAQNKLGDTPLHLACWGGHYDVVKLLMECGVDCGIKNLNGDTALSLSKDDRVSAMIINHTASVSKSASNLSDDSDGEPVL